MSTKTKAVITTLEIEALREQMGKPPKTPQELNEMAKAHNKGEISRDELLKTISEIDAWLKKSRAYFRAVKAAWKGGQQ